MALDGVTASAASGSGTSVATTTGASGLSFRSFLSDINPLQYIPVVGAVYRAVTGDEGNSTLRFVASLGTSFALGGPVGVGITVAEKVTGIDPERIARSLLGRLLHHGGTASSATTSVAASAVTQGSSSGATPAATPTTIAAAGAAPSGANAANRPWSAAELSAYAQSNGGLGGAIAVGATRIAGGGVTADMLNAMELKRVSSLYA